MKADSLLNGKNIVLLLGASVSLLVAHYFISVSVVHYDFKMFGLAVLVFWSPLFFSIPALMSQSLRDQVSPEIVGLKRALLFLPHALRRESPVRRELILSMIGFALGLISYVVFFL